MFPLHHRAFRDDRVFYLEIEYFTQRLMEKLTKKKVEACKSRRKRSSARGVMSCERHARWPSRVALPFATPCRIAKNHLDKPKATHFSLKISCWGLTGQPWVALKHVRFRCLLMRDALIIAQTSSAALVTVALASSCLPLAACQSISNEETAKEKPKISNLISYSGSV